MENNLINFKGTSKVVTTLIEAVSRGIGTLYEPINIKRLAKAKADETIILAKAECEKKQIMTALEAKSADYIPSVQLELIVSRIVGKELKRQENIDSVVRTALEDLNNAQSISDKKTETDWLIRFFNIVEDVSDEELRIVWGKILSQEIQSPGSYSLRTLSTLSNLSRSEAELFAKVSNYIFGSSNCCFLIRQESVFFGANLCYEDISQLMECGLIKESHELNITYDSEVGQISRYAISYQGFAIVIEMDKEAASLNIPIYSLTTAGSEIYKILSVEEDMQFLQKAVDYIKQPNVRFGYSKLLEDKGDVISFDDNITFM